MKNLLVLLSFLFTYNVVSAQGLSGKRFTVFYNSGYHGSSIALVLGLYGEREDPYSYYNFKDDEKQSLLKSIVNFRHSLNLNYVVNRKISTGLQFGWSRDAYGAGTLVVQNIGIPFTANYKYFSTEGEVKFFKVNRKGAIAPLGGYFALRFGMSSVKTNAKISSLISSSSEEIRTESADFQAASLALVWGKQFILYKKVMMNLGFELKHTFITEDIEPGVDRDSIFAFSTESPKTRVYWNDFIRLTVGIGLAPF